MGKSEWLQRLLRDNEGRLLRYARRWVSDQHAREIVQESFLRLWREDQERLEGRETEWLFCVCRNLACDALKKDAKAVGMNDEPVAEAEGAEESMVRKQQEGEITRLIGELPMNHQEVIRLKFQEGFSYKEISAITGHSVSHIGVMIHEAMKRLRRELKQEAVGNEN